MTAGEAIKELEEFEPVTWGVVNEAYNMAIEALQFQRSVTKCKDCISYSKTSSFCVRYSESREEDDYCSLAIRVEV